MANVIHRTTLQYLQSVNEPDYPEPTWKWSPDMSAVAGLAAIYWKWDVGTERPIPQTAPEQAATNAAIASAANTAARSQAGAKLDAGDMLAKLVKALAGVLADELTLRQIVVGEASQTWDAANMANATGTTSPTFTVAGAAFGDYVDVSASITLAGVVAVGYVSASNTVVIRLHNGTGGAVNLASATWKVSVRRPVVRTLAQAKAAVATKISNGESD